ncbi:MAG: hypothetical protein FWG71_05265 [Synergistaceae bacterium]|nr:hypothetical protein [Synergistaceae bacterium]
MLTQTAERQGLHQTIDSLSDSAIGKLANYIDFLRYEERMEELEEAEDIAYIEAHKDDPIVPFDLKDFDAE